jgi:aminoglycoside/choline kinase family phosphotransferase
VIAHLPDKRIALIEDLGDVSLSSFIAHKTDAKILALYRKVIDFMLILHSRGRQLVKKKHSVLAEPFSAKLYKWERELFTNCFLKKYLQLPGRTSNRITADLARVSEKLLHEPQALIHRDLQSSNIMVRRGRLYFIDFQGMRCGSSLYDLASLLCDPYVALSHRIQEELVSYYAARAKRKESLIRDLFPLAGIQRLIQALGAFGRMAAVPDTARFAQFILPALRQLQTQTARTKAVPALKLALPDIISLASKKKMT